MGIKVTDNLTSEYDFVSSQANSWLQSITFILCPEMSLNNGLKNCALAAFPRLPRRVSFYRL